MIDVSLIIINYNSKKLLDDCLNSVLEFTKEVSFEIIVVDNGSTVNLDDLISKYPKVKFILNEKSKGFAAVNNQGFASAKGNYLLMLNNDVLFIEDSISKIVEFSKEQNDNAIIGCTLLNEDKTFQISIVDFDSLLNLFGESFFLYKIFKRNKRLNKYHNNYCDLKEVKEVDALKGAFLFFPAEVFKKLNGLDERFFFYYEETDFCYRWKQLGGKVVYYPDTKIIHLGGASTESNLKFKFFNQHIARIQFFQKHFYGMKFVLMLLIHWLGLLLRVPIYFCFGIVRFNRYSFIKSKYYFQSLFMYPKKLETI
jgi:GT2 family glycosyltransferase